MDGCRPTCIVGMIRAVMLTALPQYQDYMNHGNIEELQAKALANNREQIIMPHGALYAHTRLM